MSIVTYSRRVKSNNNSYQTEESMKSLLLEIMPDADEVTAELVPCYDNDGGEYTEDGYMDISITLENTEQLELGVYNEVDEALESKFICIENS